MRDNLIKHIIGFFFTLILVFSTNMQGIAGYLDYQIKLEQNACENITSESTKALFSQTSTEEENHHTSSKEITEKIHYFHVINLFTFIKWKENSFIDFHHSILYSSLNNGVTTPPPELI